MITFLFWNIERKPLSSLITNLAHRHKVDVLMLAECKISPSDLLLSLNAQTTQYDYAKSPGCNKIHIFTKFPRQLIPATVEAQRLTIRNLSLPGRESLLLAVTHMPSKVNWSEDSLAQECTNLSRLIQRAEHTAGHTRTILVGDFNMNPFEKGVVSATGLHGVMDRKIAQRKSRTIQSESYHFFYNPMWGYLGDASPYPPGTHYYNTAQPVSYFWHMYDQVLVRPDLLNVFHNTDLEILTSDGETPFLTEGGVPNGRISDHLPILFKLRL